MALQAHNQHTLNFTWHSRRTLHQSGVMPSSSRMSPLSRTPHRESTSHCAGRQESTYQKVCSKLSLLVWEHTSTGMRAAHTISARTHAPCWELAARRSGCLARRPSSARCRPRWSQTWIRRSCRSLRRRRGGRCRSWPFCHRRRRQSRGRASGCRTAPAGSAGCMWPCRCWQKP